MLIEHLDDFGCQDGLQMTRVSVGAIEIAIDVAAAVNQFERFVDHFNCSFKRPIRSMVWRYRITTLCRDGQRIQARVLSVRRKVFKIFPGGADP